MDITQLENIVRDTEGGHMTIDQIVQKYNITRYKYTKIVKEYGLKKDYVQSIDNDYRKKPKNTKFKQVLLQANVETPDFSAFDLMSFKKDCEEGVKISMLMDKYKLSLYQVRELRKVHDLKTR